MVNRSQDEFRSSVLKIVTDRWVLKLITLLALLYLVSIPLGQKNKFQPPDVAIFLAILLFNSGLVERLGKLEYKDGAISIEINELKKKQETQRERVEANTELIRRLTSLEQAMADNKQKKQLIYQRLINEYEIEHLKRLASDETYLKYENRQTLKQELRRLRTLGFIESLTNKQIGLMSKQGNLRDYVRLTERGKEYLKLIEEVDADVSHDNEVAACN